MLDSWAICWHVAPLAINHGFEDQAEPHQWHGKREDELPQSAPAGGVSAGASPVPHVFNGSCAGK